MELIDRAEVQYKMLEILPEADSLEWYEQAKPDEVKDLVDELYIIVLNANQIDAQPVKHGKWEWEPGYVGTTAKCSVCGLSPLGFYSLPKIQIGRLPEYKFCPNCGADMIGDDANS